MDIGRPLANPVDKSRRPDTSKMRGRARERDSKKKRKGSWPLFEP